MGRRLIAVYLVLGMIEPAAAADRPLILVQAMVPQTGMGDAERPMAAEERMRRRFPQPVRVGDLIGLPVIDETDRTLGYVRRVVRAADGKVELIVAYNGWCGWCGLATRPVAVPIEVVGMLGREVASLDMPRRDYAAAPTWQDEGATTLADDTAIAVGLARR